MNENKLRILADWLLNKEFYSRDGVVENAIKYAKEDVCRTISDYIAEIIHMDDEEIKNELKDINNGKG